MMDAVNARAYSADLSTAARRHEWAIRRCPKAVALGGRAYDVDNSLPSWLLRDGEWIRNPAKAGLKDLLFVLGLAVSQGQEVDVEFEREAEEMLARAEGRPA